MRLLHCFLFFALTWSAWSQRKTPDFDITTGLGYHLRLQEHGDLMETEVAGDDLLGSAKNPGLVIDDGLNFNLEAHYQFIEKFWLSGLIRWSNLGFVRAYDLDRAAMSKYPSLRFYDQSRGTYNNLHLVLKTRYAVLEKLHAGAGINLGGYQFWKYRLSLNDNVVHRSSRHVWRSMSGPEFTLMYYGNKMSVDLTADLQANFYLTASLNLSEFLKS